MPPSTSAWVALIALSVTIMLQFGGIIWFAAMMKSGQTVQQAVVQELRNVVHSLQEFTSALDRRVAILEDRHTRTD